MHEVAVLFFHCLALHAKETVPVNLPPLVFLENIFIFIKKYHFHLSVCKSKCTLTLSLIPLILSFPQIQEKLRTNRIILIHKTF